MELNKGNPGRPSNVSAFTLVELLVVIAVVTMLIALLLPAIKDAKESARRVQCLSNQRQIALAIFAYANDQKGIAPPIGPPWTYAWTWIPYWWHLDLCYEPLTYYGVNYSLLECPSSEFAKGGYVDTPFRLSAQLYLPGLPEYGAIWYDSDPSAASLEIGKDLNKLLVTDVNLWDRGERRLVSNHSGGNILNVTLEDMVQHKFIKGGNRVYADGHGLWVTPRIMGKDEGPITADYTRSRYSHSTFLVRPYWW